MTPRTEAKPTPETTVRFSIRSKLLVLVAGTLIAAMGVYLTLAVDLMRDDKLTYAYDLNQAAVATLSSQVRATFQSVERELRLFGESAFVNDREAGTAMAQRLLVADPELVRLTLFGPNAQGELQPLVQVVETTRLEPLGLTADDLTQLDRSLPLPLTAAAADGTQILNRSLPPASQLFSMVVAQDGEAPSWLVAADMTQDQLLEIFSQRRVYTAYLIDAQGRVLTHPDREAVALRKDVSTQPIVQAALAPSRVTTARVAEFATPTGIVLGGFGEVGVGRLHVITEIAKETALAASRRLVRVSILIAIAIVLAAFFISILVARSLTEPLTRLSQAATELAAGTLQGRIEVRTGDEIGKLAQDFSAMRDKLKDAQVKLVQSEKMAAFGQLGAGVTHEVKNPLTGVLGLAELALTTLDDRAGVKAALEDISSATKRCIEIVSGFLVFARQESGEKTTLDLNEVIKGGLKLVAHQLAIEGVEVHAQYGELPPVAANAGHVQQMVLNLALNAQQAMGPGGNLYVTTRRLEDGRAELEMRDDGPGIPAEIQARIFEPFFTTKGAGTGLGLSITHGIVEDHGGELLLESEVGQGATFRIRLPPAGDSHV